MSALIDTLVVLASAYPTAVGLLAFAIALLECLAIVGAVFPGTILLVTLGALISAGEIGPWEIMVWAIMRAIVGNSLSYRLGHRYRERVQMWRVVRAHALVLARAEAFFRHHGGASVFLARFMPGLRAVVPLIAGMSGMTANRFLTANIASAILWVPAQLLLGTTIGSAMGMSLHGVLFAAVCLLAIAAVVVGSRIRLQLRSGAAASA